MKRIGTLFITGVFFCMLLCSSGKDTGSAGNASVLQEKAVQEETVAVQENVENSAAVSKETSGKTANTSTTENAVAAEENVTLPSVSPVQNATSKFIPTTQDYGSYESVEFTDVEEVKEVEVEQITTEIADAATHTGIASEGYYQYATLDSSEKMIYQTISQAMKNADSTVDLSAYSCSIDTLTKVYQFVVADNPQYFYLSKSYGYTYDSNRRSVKQLILMYSDGTLTDRYDGRGNMTVTADRSRISQQIASFNAKVAAIVNGISTGASDLEKEKRIYNYLQDYVAYDYDAADLVNAGSYSQLPHAFDAYGAACEGVAVCEGYAELFQYLCYCVGINATQVYGTASGGSHMWNTAKIGNEWYMLDLTWDDCGYEGLYCYNYFNLTEGEISIDHSIDRSSINVPTCTSTTYAFYNYYAFYVASTSAAPANYTTVLDYLATSSDKYLCVYIKGQTESVKNYIASQILKKNSEVQKYIASKNYAISIGDSYYQIGNYCYIVLK